VIVEYPISAQVRQSPGDGEFPDTGESAQDDYLHSVGPYVQRAVWMV